MDGTIKHTEVDLAGLMRVLGEALYSTPRVAIRELVQNAHDSCIRRRLETGDERQNTVRVTCDAAAQTITVEDTGAGLTDDEIERYLATIGRGYTRELRDDKGDGDLIGYFGLGFLSTFVIADSTEVRTCSYKTPDKSWLFSTKDGQRYSIRPGQTRPIGTQVTLRIKDSQRELADAAVLEHVLRRYCALLPMEVTLGGRPINVATPPWRLSEDTGSLVRSKLTLEWASIFEPVYSPLCTIDVDEPELELSGVIWVQDGGSYASSDSRHVSVFVRGMLISDDERELLPAWAGFCGAVFESRQLQPTASRESLQKNAHLTQVKSTIAARLIEGLAKIAQRQPSTWSRVLTRHNEALLGAALSEPQLFDLVADGVTLPTTEGELTVPEVLSRCKGKIYLGVSEKSGFAELLFRALKLPVVDSARYAAAPFAARYADVRRGTIVRLGTKEGDRVLFGKSQLVPEDEATIRSWFEDLDAQIVIASFAPAAVPFVVVPDEDVVRKRRIESDDVERNMSSGALHLARMFTEKIQDRGAARLFVNASCPLLTDLLQAAPDKRERALALLRPLTTLLAHGAAPAGDIETALAAYCDGLRMILAE